MKNVHFLIIISIWCSGCSMYHKPFLQEGGKYKTKNDYVLQIDDHGSFWDQSLANSVLSKIEQESKSTNTIVLLFIHGWHHNAKIDDENAIDFYKTVNQTRKTLEDNYGGKPGLYRRTRQILTGNPDIKVIGIYIGWRGKALPMPLNYLTFWNRKSAAERIGQGDLRDFLIRLNEVYQSRVRARGLSLTEPFMGMASFGHSFGGQVLFKAVAPAIETELITKTSKYYEVTDIKEENIKGFGDIVVLVNPALEAFQYERIHKLSNQIEYKESQVPRLLILSSDTDFPRKIFFSLGRRVYTIFHASFREEQKELWIEALGEYENQITHRISIDGSKNEVEPFDPDMYCNDPDRIIKLDLTSINRIGGAEFNRTGIHKAYSPFLVARVSNDIIEGHSGRIFGVALRQLITDYVGLAQGKQLLINSKRPLECN